MKLSYKNTALGFLDDPANFPFHTPDAYNVPMTEEEDQELGYGLRKLFLNTKFSSQFKKNIQYVTQPFYEAYHRSSNKIREVVNSEPIEDCGTLIIPWPNHTQTIFYSIEKPGTLDDTNWSVMMTMFTKSPKSDSFGLDLCVYLSKEDKAIKNIVWKGFEDQGRDMTWWIADLILFKTFLKYAEAETKTIKATKRDYHIGTKYVNETKHNVEVLDSTYFTTLVRSEGFGVRGHFRWQPYPSKGDRKLIWISPFEKQGYTRTAKILKNEQ